MDSYGFGEMFNAMMVIIVVSVPLAAWKAIEIVIWLFNNVHIGLK